MIARTREQLAEFMQGRLTGAYASDDGTQPSGGDAIPIKTYLVEVQPSGVAGGSDDLLPERSLRKLLSDPLLRAKYPATVHTSKDHGLLTVAGPYRDDTSVSLYLDCKDPRYWLLHTTARSETADWIIGRMTTVGSGLARVALPGQLLGKLAAAGALQGLVVVHDRRLFTDGEGPEEAADFLSVQLWGGHSQRVLTLLNEDGTMSDCMSLSRIHVRYWPDEDAREAFSIVDVNGEGRMEARGASYDAHLGLVDIVKDSYTRQIEKIEALYRVQTDRRTGTLIGRSLTIRFNRSIGDAAEFCKVVFSGSRPFRLWGVPASTSPAFTRLRALDLNSGGLLDFEITPDLLRVFLPSGSSGNAVVRFFANSQLHLDSRVRLLDQDERDVFEF